MTAPTSDPIALTAEPLDAATVRAHLDQAGPADCGGVCIFEGCTRGEHHPEHGALLALEYQAYDAMALAQMHALAEQARERWSIGALALIHRTGRVSVGERSVMIAVACAHRDAAFAACRWLIDALKRDVPIWKKEIWSSGEGTWVDPTATR